MVLSNINPEIPPTNIGVDNNTWNTLSTVVLPTIVDNGDMGMEPHISEELGETGWWKYKKWHVIILNNNNVSTKC